MAGWNPRPISKTTPRGKEQPQKWSPRPVSSTAPAKKTSKKTS